MNTETSCQHASQYEIAEAAPMYGSQMYSDVHVYVVCRDCDTEVRDYFIVNS